MKTLDGGWWSDSRPDRIAPAGEKPQYPIDRKLGVPHNPSGHSGEEKIPIPAGYRTPVVQSVVQPLYRLSYHGSSYDVCV